MALQRRTLPRRDGTAAEQQAGAILADGQMGFATDTNDIKFGDGVSDWNTLEVANRTVEMIQDIVGAMFTGNTETGIAATYQDSDGTIDLVI